MRSSGCYSIAKLIFSTVRISAGIGALLQLASESRSGLSLPKFIRSSFEEGSFMAMTRMGTIEIVVDKAENGLVITTKIGKFETTVVNPEDSYRETHVAAVSRIAKEAFMQMQAQSVRDRELSQEIVDTLPKIEAVYLEASRAI